MTIKELEKEVKEIKEMVKSLITLKEIRENTTKQLTISDIEVGEQFIYCGHKYTKLNENNYCIIDDYDDSFMWCIFDSISNDYTESIIRQYINSDRFINKLGVNVEDLEEIYSNTDYITLISRDEYEQYRKLIKDYDYYWMTRSASSNSDNDFCCINIGGYIGNYGVYGTYAARVCFNLKPETKVDEVNE